MTLFYPEDGSIWFPQKLCKFTPIYSFGGDSPLYNLTPLINIRSYLYHISLCRIPEDGISQSPLWEPQNLTTHHKFPFWGN